MLPPTCSLIVIDSMIYLHIPFCHRKCTYCAFYSVVTSSDKQAYVDALCSELAMRRHEVCHPVRTVYFGGGTPTVLTIGQIGQIVETIRLYYDVSAIEEATLEANPEDLTQEYLKGLKSLGFFNRISIGVQSFHDSDLKLLNRRHSAHQAVEAVKEAFVAGFGNISIDLIYGLPHQSVKQGRERLMQVEGLGVSHLSAYALSVEPGTMLWSQVEQGRVVVADEEESLQHYETLIEWSSKTGFGQYEISSFCKQGFKSRHNSRYWDYTPYLGVGAAAHSFDGHSRRWNVPDVRKYVASVVNGAIDFQKEDLDENDAYNEYVMTALRTTDGIAKAMIPSKYAKELSRSVEQLVAKGLIMETPTHYVPTRQGLLQADGIAAELFID